ncbi:GNAT family N-acetyltransferase [Rhizobium wenxiniae]|uniref:GNAT family N-acetyltransferase n=1 Tax=Rhizobium wenxiniae TaxID=1737357 RepID=UPI001CB79978|nr:GNAT family N-acetyltransferase [Rhizobium wenxiniae]
MMERVTIAETPRLILGTWLQSDRDLFREINADPKVMEFFPFRRSHEEADAFLGKLNGMMTSDGLGFYAVVLKDTDEPIGFCGLSHPNLPGIFPNEAIEIGWRLATRFWGNGYINEAAGALLDKAFSRPDIDEVVSFAVAANQRSTNVMQRLGMRREQDRDFNHPRVPDTHPHLKRHVVYTVSRDEWQANRPA